ncbi:DUF1641 domain-containing protein [Alicyclobacillus fastidiosus]|uniref:DUF1641 domain-containing protein n=1 Tax=Alicyclobacillus fastidiosus TaxID=392011 RepID=A0ABY6ZFU7_9BACL|nr:DUF1641 domain-containing protein [Alicyclobacillus fastidiosus]WAH41091.1 DUF1641 domain-containing protein [Alicyclobacillus fastidiosus]GMA62646.1 hypothetical protein GCM10025859_30860 [Alicyclobacillus fastidiosus]
MAQAIQKVVERDITPEKVLYESQVSIEDELFESKDAVIQVLKLVRLLHETEFLNMATALLEQGTDVLEIVVNQAKQPQYAKGIKNMMGLAQLLGMIDVGSLTGVVEALSQSAERAQRGQIEPVHGPLKLLGAMRDPDVGAGLGFAFDLLRSLGRQIRAQGAPQAVRGGDR